MYPISMVNFCAVVSYTNKAKKEFCLPVVVTDIGEKDCDVCKRQQDAWLARIGR